MLVAGLIGGLGLVSIASRRTLLGVLIGVQLLILGSTMMFVLAGIYAGAAAPLERANGHVGGVLIVLGGLAQIAAGYALATRLFYLRNRAEMRDLRSLNR